MPMTKKKRSDRVNELHTLLKNDWKGRHRKYPDQAIFAINDARVANALEKRFEKNGVIKQIRSLHYDFFNGLNNLYFEFMAITGSTGPPSRDAFLVLMDGDCNVVGLRDPFDPGQPNTNIPPLPNEGELPFVLYQPSESENLVFSEQEMFPEQVRSREFFKRLTADRSEWPPEGATETQCTYWTHTLVCKDAYEDRTVDDSGPTIYTA
jgi:hypothetical protein